MLFSLLTLNGRQKRMNSVAGGSLEKLPSQSLVGGLGFVSSSLQDLKPDLLSQVTQLPLSVEGKKGIIRTHQDPKTQETEDGDSLRRGESSHPAESAGSFSHRHTVLHHPAPSEPIS